MFLFIFFLFSFICLFVCFIFLYFVIIIIIIIITFCQLFSRLTCCQPHISNYDGKTFIHLPLLGGPTSVVNKFGLMDNDVDESMVAPRLIRKAVTTTRARTVYPTQVWDATLLSDINSATSDDRISV